MIRRDGEAAATCRTTPNLKLQEIVRLPVGEPVDNRTCDVLSSLPIIRKDLDGSSPAYETTDLLSRAIGEKNTRVVMQAPEHYAYLLADLVDEDHDRARARDGGGELAERLRHQPGLQAGQRIAHIAVELGLGHQRSDGVDRDDVHRIRAHQRLGDLERLLAGVGLRDQQLVDVDAELPGVRGIKRVLGIDERGDAAQALRFGDDVQRQRRLAGRFRPVDLADASTRQAADAERGIETERARGNDPDLLERAGGAEPHDSALTELPLDLGDREVESLSPVALPFRHRVLPSENVLRHSRSARPTASMSEARDSPPAGRQRVGSEVTRRRGRMFGATKVDALGGVICVCPAPAADGPTLADAAPTKPAIESTVATITTR